VSAPDAEPNTMILRPSILIFGWSSEGNDLTDVIQFFSFPSMGIRCGSSTPRPLDRAVSSIQLQMVIVGIFDLHYNFH
jgi:hypothetical protein